MKRWLSIRGYVFVFLFFILLVTPRGVSKGIFFDGLTYSSIARNLAEGVGTFWNPYYTETIYPIFHELLPLQFYLQSFWFKIFGDQIWIEKMYGIFIMLLTILFFILALKELEKLCQDNELSGSQTTRLCWSSFLFVIMPMVIYSSLNNLLENTVLLFVVLSTFSVIKSFSSKASPFWSILSGVFIMGAFLSKSIPGIFPLIIYPAAGIIFRKQGWFKRWCYQLSVVFALLIVIFIFSNEGKIAILNHLKQQVFASVAGKRGTLGGRFTPLKCFIQEFSIPIVFALLLCGVKGWRFGRTQKFLLIIGLAGFLPLLISPKQARRYILPSLPFFTASLGYCSVRGISRLKNKKIAKIFNQVAIPLLVVVSIILGILGAGKVYKNKNLWKEVLPVWDELQANKKRIIVQTCGFSPGWEEHAFYQRYFKWSFGKGPYILQRVNVYCSLPSNIELLIDGPQIKLWALKSGSFQIVENRG